MTENYNPDNLTQAELWGLGVSSLLTEMNQGRHDILRHGEVSDVRHFVKRDWGIETRDELLDMLKLLEDQGHNQSYLEQQIHLNSLSEPAINAYIDAHNHDEKHHAQLSIIKNNRYTLRKGGIGAWDDGRHVSLCRWGLIMELISEEECWDFIFKTAKKVQTAYRDWYSFGVSYTAGKLYWQGLATEESSKNEMSVVRRLTGNVYSPWNKLDWDESLAR